MSKRKTQKYKIDRQLGENLWGRPKSPVNKRKYGPGQHGQNRGKLSDYGIQLRAKQKLKGYYGNIMEKQFKRIYKEAQRRKGDTSENIIGLLEQRLDAVIYRSKFAPTVFSSRQFISHKHVKVNGVTCNIPSRRVNVGDIIEFSTKMKENVVVISAIESSERDVPDYLNVSHDHFKIEYIRVPKLDEVPYPVIMQPNLVVEFYSR